MPDGIYLLLGTNLGNRSANLKEARQLIVSRVGKIVNASTIYETAPWGVTNQPPYLNQVIQVDSALTPENLLQTLLLIENMAGRVRSTRWESRILDIDILFYDKDVISTKDLIIPHPHLHERKFTLVPLSELAPNIIHPVLKLSVQQILNQCPDPLSVYPYVGES